ncbi:MAG: hypothetical protein M3O82_01145 [Verrucomicrobiota bacterium]|nr:hypothetical protein [Verrucomicrobiota bacterium]
MTANRIRDLLHAVPFTPFKIFLADGAKLRVPHPDFISVAPSGRIAVVIGPKDQVYTVDVFLISALETEPLKTKSAKK